MDMQARRDRGGFFIAVWPGLASTAGGGVLRIG
jgi:hypothetical protein